MTVALVKPIGIFGRSLHQQIIGDLPVRYWFKDDTKPLDNKWIIRTESSTLRNKPPVIIDFNQYLTAFPSSINLLDPERERDLITLKLVVYYSLSDKPVGWNKTGVSASNTFRQHLLFLKWRLENGIECNADLNAVWHREYIRSLRDGGRDALLSMPKRISSFCNAWDERAFEPPLNQRGEVNAERVAEMLGLQNARAFTASTRRIVHAFITQKGFGYARTYVPSQKRGKLRNVAENTVNAFLMPWLQLWNLRGLLAHDPIGYRAYLHPREIARETKWAEPRNWTKDAPAYQTSWLINACLKLLQDDLIGELFQIVENGLDPSGRPKDSHKFGAINDRLCHLGFPELQAVYMSGSRSGEKSDLATIRTLLLVFIPICCAVVICAFTGRRNEERASLETDCVEVDERGNVWLKCLIVKNIRGVDRIPVPVSVKHAVDILRRLHSYNRFRDDRWLFNIACPLSGKPAAVSLSKNLSKTCKWLGVPPLEDGNYWNFTPHQFRKFFGITYFYRWMFPNLTALSFHYRHFNPDTTRGYLKLKAAAALRMTEEKRSISELEKRDLARESDTVGLRSHFVRHVLQMARNGTELTGAAGRRITQEINELKDKFLSEIEITKGGYDVPGFEAALENLAKATRMQIHPEGHSICLCDNSNAEKARSKCLALKQSLTGQIPSDNAEVDFAYADDDTCLACPHSARVPAIAPYWQRALADARFSIKYADGEQAEAIERRISTIEAYA